MIMVAVIIVIMAAGVLSVGYLQGWFDSADGTLAVLTEIHGVVNLQRDGVIFPVESDTVLRSDDRISASSGATAVIRVGESYLAIGNAAELTICDPSATGFAAAVISGEVFVNTDMEIKLSFDGKELSVSNSVAAVSVRSGAQTLSVFRGNVSDAQAGQAISYVGEEVSVYTMDLNSLNDFMIRQIRMANQSVTLCFTNTELDKLEADRRQAIQDLIDSMNPSQPDTTVPEPTDSTQSSQPQQTTPGAPVETTQPTGSASTQPDKDTKPTGTTSTVPSSTGAATTKPENTQPPATQTPSTPVGSCYITIRCDTILDNWDSLNPAKAEFVPANGVILPVVEVPFYEGETVFDILKRVCDITDIALEYSWTPLYNSYYLEGINNLYEMDCGDQSGWMYKVNEIFPNYGASSYTLSNGDVIVFCYTCNGYGEDVGKTGW